MTGADLDRPAELRVRIPRINLFAIAVAAVCTIPLAFASPWLAVVWLLPIAGLAHVLRTGVDADPSGLTIHTLLGSRRLAWDDIAGLRIRRSRVSAVRRDGSTVRLPVLRPRHLSLIAAASGGRLPDPSAGATASPEPSGRSGGRPQPGQ
jgi:Bacterial PH domain